MGKSIFLVLFLYLSIFHLSAHVFYFKNNEWFDYMIAFSTLVTSMKILDCVNKCPQRTLSLNNRITSILLSFIMIFYFFVRMDVEYSSFLLIEIFGFGLIGFLGYKEKTYTY